MHNYKKILNVGDKIKLRFDNDDNTKQYSSQIIDYFDDDSFDIATPIFQNRILYIKNQAILVLILSKGEAIYEFKVMIINRTFTEIPFLRVKIIDDIKKIQRRNYYRLKYLSTIKIRKVEDLKEKKYGDITVTNTLDISGGGISIISPNEFQENDLLEITIKINNSNMLLYGKVVRKDFNTNNTSNNNTNYMYGIQYIGISEIQRNEITKFIFQEQRKLAKKGLI